MLKIEQVHEIIAENKLKNKVSSIEDYAIEVVAEPEKNFNNAMGQESLTRFDQPKAKKRPSKKRKPNAGATANVAAAPAIAPNKPAAQNGNKKRPHNNKNRGNANDKKQGNAPTNEPRKPIIITKNGDKK